MNRPVVSLAVLPISLMLALAACDQSQPKVATPVTASPVAVSEPAPAPQPVTAAPAAHTLSMQIVSLTSGASGSSTQKYRSSLYWRGTDIRARLDLPGTLYPDKKSRLVYLDYTKQKASVYLADTRQLDISANQGAVAKITAKFAQSNFSNFMPSGNSQQPTLSQTLAMLKTAGFHVQKGTSSLSIPGSTNQKYTLISRTQSVGDTTQDTIAELDQSGALVQVKDTQTQPDLTTTTVSNLTYSAVDGVDHPVVTTINTSVRTERLGPTRVSTLKLPVSTETFDDNHPLVLKPGEFIAATTPKLGEGEYDPNVLLLKEKTILSDFEVDQQTASDFVGGN